LSANIFQKLTERYPFITVISYGDNEFIGIVQNQDAIVTNFYDFAAIPDAQSKRLFLELGEQWWWESTRQVPINIFLRGEWNMFKAYLRSFNSKDVKILHGPVVSLADLAQKKSKRRSITLIRKVSH
jgi:hypothetical protein